MTARHIPALTALETVCFAAPWTAEGFAEELQNPLAHFLVAEDSGNVWGTSLPYLRPVNSSLDKQAPVYMQQQCIGIGRLSAALGVDDASDIYVEKRTQSGYVLCVRAGGKTFSGDDIRRCLSLRSNNFYVDINGDTANFVVYGYGHGIGMSQYGAEYMAGNGAGYREILAHYYTGVSFGRLCEIN